MDSADVRIFCEMTLNETGSTSQTKRQASAADIGKKLHLDEKTVRTRIRNMERAGFIKYYQVRPNLALFGLRSMGSFRFEALNLATKHAVIEKINSVPRLIEESDYLGNFVGATFAGSTSTDVSAAADALAKRFELDKTWLGDRAVREPLSKLDRADWLIIRDLRFDAKAKIKTMAEKLGLSERMVEYRSSKLTSSGAILFHAVIDTNKQAGLVFFEVEISVRKGKLLEVVRRVRELYGENLWKFSTPTPEKMVASFFGFSLNRPEELALAIRKMEGVMTSYPFILKEVIEPDKPNWVDDSIQEAIESHPR